MNTHETPTKKLMQVDIGTSLNNKNYYEAHITDHNNNFLTFPTSYYFYLKDTNMLFYKDFNNNYVLKIPPSYQFLKVIQNNNAYSLSLCDANGQIFSKNDFIQISNKEKNPEFTKLTTNNLANIIDNTDITTITPILKQNINLEECYKQSQGNFPSFFLSKIKNAVEESVHIFKLSSKQDNLDINNSIGTLNNEAAFFTHDNNHAKDYPYYFKYINADSDSITKIYAPSYVDKDLLSTAENNVLKHAPIYLIIHDNQFYFSNTKEDSITTIDDESAIKLLQQVNLIEPLTQNIYNIKGKFAFEITKGKEINDYYYGTVNKVNVVLKTKEITLTSSHNTDDMFFSDLYFCHLREDDSKIMSTMFEKYLDVNAIIKELTFIDPIYIVSSNNTINNESHLLINNTEVLNIHPLTTLLSHNIKTHSPLDNIVSTNDQSHNNINSLHNITTNNKQTLNDVHSPTNNIKYDNVTHKHYDKSVNNTESNDNTSITNNQATVQYHTSEKQMDHDSKTFSTNINHILSGKLLDNGSHALIIKANYDETLTFYTNAINKYNQKEYTYDNVMTLFNYVVKDLSYNNEHVVQNAYIDSNNHIYINNNDFDNVETFNAMFQ